jgi:hypothetical protein
MMAGGNIVYDFKGPNQAIANGGIGTIHQFSSLNLPAQLSFNDIPTLVLRAKN